MLFFKAWLETRWRFVFMLVSTALCLLIPYTMNAPTQRAWVGITLEFALLNCVTAAYLAGSGINAQTLYSATSGFHGSMLFTLSLPVSRRRLLLTRAGLGALETASFVLLTAGVLFVLRPATISAATVLRYLPGALLSTLAIYALSTLLACLLDEMWQFSGTLLLLGALWSLNMRLPAAIPYSPLHGLNLSGYAQTMPWASMAVSLAAIVLLLPASLWVLNRKEC